MFIPKMPETNINIQKFYTYHHKTKNKLYTFSGDRHTFWEMHIVLNGSKILTCEDKIIHLSKGQMYLIPPNEFHRYTVTDVELEYIVLTFDMDFVPPDNVYTLSRENLNLIHMMVSEMKEKFPDGDFNEASSKAPQILKLIAELIIIRAVSHDVAPCIKSEYSDIYEKAVNFMKANIFDTISSNDIADFCQISNSTLKKIFKSNTDIGVMHYYNELKMEYAKKLLLDGVSVSKIAEELNFSSQAYFSSAFKKYSGKSPLTFKREQIKKCFKDKKL